MSDGDKPQLTVFVPTPLTADQAYELAQLHERTRAALFGLMRLCTLLPKGDDRRHIEGMISWLELWGTPRLAVEEAEKP